MTVLLIAATMAGFFTFVSVRYFAGFYFDAQK